MNNNTRDTIIGGVILVLFLIGVLFITYTLVDAAINAFDPPLDNSIQTIIWKEVTPPHEGLRCWQTGRNDYSWGWCESQ